jgi:chemotaxis protein CheD
MVSSKETELPVIYLRSGELYFTDRPTVVVTLLGSCVSITMFHRRLKLSAISHGILPRCRNQRACNGGCNDASRYVECALPIMLEWFKQRRGTASELEVGIFGGADLFGFGAGNNSESTLSVGKQNTAIALQVLEREGIHALAKDVGGSQSRKIHFNTQNGDIKLLYLQPTVVLSKNTQSG